MNTNRLKTVMITLIVVTCIIFTIVVYWFIFTTLIPKQDEGGTFASSYTNYMNADCNIAVIPILGEIIPYRGANLDGTTYIENMPPSVNMEDTLLAIEIAESDPNITGIMLRIDSTGGTPVSAEMIARALKKSTLPVASFITETGASGAYLIATGADTIIASPFSDVGSIGVSMSYLDNSAQNKEEGLEFISLASGKFKDSGIGDKPLRAEERALFERDLSIYHTELVKQIAENRNLPVEEVEKLADGSTLPGKLALESKLVDKLGDIETVRTWFAEKNNVELTDVVLCQ
jgi:protease-4